MWPLVLLKTDIFSTTEWCEWWWWCSLITKRKSKYYQAYPFIKNGLQSVATSAISISNIVHVYIQLPAVLFYRCNRAGLVAEGGGTSTCSTSARNNNTSVQSQSDILLLYDTKKDPSYMTGKNKINCWQGALTADHKQGW